MYLWIIFYPSIFATHNADVVLCNKCNLYYLMLKTNGIWNVFENVRLFEINTVLTFIT